MTYETVVEIAVDNLGYVALESEEFSSGVNFESYQVTLSDGSIVFMKGYTEEGEDERGRLKRERDVLDFLSESSISFTPQVYDSWFGDGCGVIVCEFVHGEVFSREVMKDSSFAKSIGEYLSEIHSLSASSLSSGQYRNDGLGLVEETTEAISGSPYESEYKSLVESCTMAVKETSAVPGLTHGDFHPPNMLFESESNEVANIIDWEYGGVSDVLIDLAKAEVRVFLLYKRVYEEVGQSVDSLLLEFREGYGYGGVDRERLNALKTLFVLREIGLVWHYGELDTWERVSDSLSAISECERVLEELVNGEVVTE